MTSAISLPASHADDTLCADVIAASSSAAQLIITAMFKVVKTAQPSALPPVRAALALCFERQPRGAAYISALQRFAIEDRGGAVDAAEVAAAAVHSGSLQSGALQVFIVYKLPILESSLGYAV